MKLKNVAVVTAFVSLIGAAAHAGTVTVLGTDDIFAAGLLAPPLSTDGGGTLPSFYSVAPGQTLDITATGSVSCCLGSSTGPTGPDGFASNPFGSGSAITNSTGSTVSSFTGSGAFPLVATFFGASGAVGSVFTVGSSDLGVIVPKSATEIYFGLPDGSGFSGPSGYYGDNAGSFTVNISAVPEPSVWIMMMAGVAIVGAALRFGRKRRLATFAA